MSWAKFRTEYKKGFFAEEDMATVMSDAYDECVKTGMGGATMAHALGNKDGLKTLLTACFKAYGAVPFPTALDSGLSLYWVGAAAGASIAAPGITTAFTQKENDTLDKFITQLIKSFDNYHKQIVFTQPGTPPVVTTGYTIQPEE